MTAATNNPTAKIDKAVALYEKQDFDAARELLDEASTDFTSAGDTANLALAAYHQGIINMRMGRELLALRKFSEARSGFSENDLPAKAAECEWNIGLIHVRDKKFPEGRDHLTKALRVMEREGDEASTAAIGMQLAEVCGVLNLFAEAADALHGAISFGEKHNPALAGEATFMKSAMQYRLGKKVDCLASLDQAATFYRKAGATDEVARVEQMTAKIQGEIG